MGRGWGVNEVEAISSPRRLPSFPGTGRPPGALSSARPPAASCTGPWRPTPSGEDLALRTGDGQAQLAVHPHRGGEEPASQGHVSAAGAGSLNFPGRGAAPYA